VRRTLVVANRTAQTPVLLQEITRRAEERPTAFTLLVPDTAPNRVDWTLEQALKALTNAARGLHRQLEPHVDGIAGGDDPFVAVMRALETASFDDVLISTLPAGRSEWLRRKLPERIAQLGVEVMTITPPAPTRDRVVRFLLPGRHERGED
jgi:hypothetical protein